MRRKLGILLIVGALITVTLLGAVRISAQPQILLSFDYEYIRQGMAGVVNLSGADVLGGVIETLDRVYPFFPVTNGFASLVSVPLNQKIKKDYPLSVTVYLKDGSSVKSEGVLRVESGEYIRESNFVIPKDRMYLLDPEIQQNEDLRLTSIYSVVTPTRFWEGRFATPVNAATTSPFGSVRSYNDGSTRRHTGVDFRVTTGIPISAAATGRVVFARGLDIHGYNVIIDHGWGVFTNYSHLSQIFVVPGQMVLQGEIIGLTGNTGRSTGPHLHFEVAVNGNWVSPVEFLKLKMPT